MIFNVMFYVGLVLFILFLIATVALFFVLKIPKAIGVVTGQTQKKAIEEIRSGGTRPSGRRTKVKESAILARDVGGKAADTSSALRKGTKSVMMKRSTQENLEEIAEKARLDAKKATDKAKEVEKQRKIAEAEESTEVLTYNEYKKGTGVATSEETTSVLEEEQATAILTEDEASADASATRGEAVQKARYDASSDEESTDILRPTYANAVSDEEDVTDILRTTAARADLYDDDLDEEPGETQTDVLTEDMGSKLAEDEIYGVYNPEMTAVLKSDMTPNEDSIRPRKKVSLDGITVLYSETIVHTDECL